ncbi:unnamed protein product [Lactuca saligna]|uniref:Uncharacterized protein n=1 Tax=Lactuca saligna TaxID=75948 RepID=A0AA35ZVY0_LACSI|nr:unnamed protein product [Lactuca saligna]
MKLQVDCGAYLGRLEARNEDGSVDPSHTSFWQHLEASKHPLRPAATSPLSVSSTHCRRNQKTGSKGATGISPATITAIVVHCHHSSSTETKFILEYCVHGNTSRLFSHHLLDNHTLRGSSARHSDRRLAVDCRRPS